MTGPDFETLLRSPLDDESESNGWGSAVLGLVGGGVAVIGLSVILGLWATSAEAPPTSLTTDTALPATDEPVGAYLSMPTPRQPRSVGGVDLFWNQGFNVHPDEGSTVRITATVLLVSPESVDVVFELDSVPSSN